MTTIHITEDELLRILTHYVARHYSDLVGQRVRFSGIPANGITIEQSTLEETITGDKEPL
jgi:hypothetical protein